MLVPFIQGIKYRSKYLPARSTRNILQTVQISGVNKICPSRVLSLFFNLYMLADIFIAGDIILDPENKIIIPNTNHVLYKWFINTIIPPLNPF